MNVALNDPSEMKNFSLYNVSIHRNFHQNWSMNKFSRKKKAKIPDLQGQGNPESRTFLLDKRSYALNT